VKHAEILEQLLKLSQALLEAEQKGLEFEALSAARDLYQERLQALGPIPSQEAAECRSKLEHLALLIQQQRAQLKLNQAALNDKARDLQRGRKGLRGYGSTLKAGRHHGRYGSA